MKLEVGKYYRTRDGRKVGPIRGEAEDWRYYEGAVGYYKDDGSAYNRAQDQDLVAEWTDTPEVGPVRTVTRQEIVPGVYGKVDIESLREDGRVDIMVNACMTADELTDAIATLTAIRDAMQANTTA